MRASTTRNPLLAARAAAALAWPCAASAQGSAASGPAATFAAPPGLVYSSLREGKGASPTAADAVKVHYRGTLPDGTEFDSSYKRGQPASFPLNGVIKCWTEGVQRMKVGGKAKLVCPPELAYGERGAGGVIPPNATLRFEVELLGDQPALTGRAGPQPGNGSIVSPSGRRARRGGSSTSPRSSWRPRRCAAGRPSGCRLRGCPGRTA